MSGRSSSNSSSMNSVEQKINQAYGSAAGCRRRGSRAIKDRQREVLGKRDAGNVIHLYSEHPLIRN